MAPLIRLTSRLVYHQAQRLATLAISDSLRSLQAFIRQERCRRRASGLGRPCLAIRSRRLRAAGTAYFGGQDFWRFSRPRRYDIAICAIRHFLCRHIRHATHLRVSGRRAVLLIFMMGDEVA